MKLAHWMALCVALTFAEWKPAAAQHHGGGAIADDAPAAASPYAAMSGRAVKALSAEQIADLRAGRGIDLALVAELNGYPGPTHVLELADALALTTDQRSRTQALLEAMRRETIPLGERILADEVLLDRLFAERTVTPESLAATTARIGAAQGALRAAHLRYHFAMTDVLSPAQAARYVELRGYDSPEDDGLQ